MRLAGKRETQGTRLAGRHETQGYKACREMTVHGRARPESSMKLPAHNWVMKVSTWVKRSPPREKFMLRFLKSKRVGS